MSRQPKELRARGRYAPSPTGDLHLGNASTALLAWLSIRAKGGDFVMRMEDLDRPRVRPGAAEAILADLLWLGLDWDEGPDRGGPHAPYDQASRGELYEGAFRSLRERGLVYPCFCSRRDIAAAASAPQEPGEEVRYPGTCRALAEDEVHRRQLRGDQHAWRFRAEGKETPSFIDLVRGTSIEPTPLWDFVVRRADGVPAYQLAVVVDDACMGITEVVRGEDLLSSTPRQILLYQALGFAPPLFAHVPLLVGTDGVRLSKRHRGTSIAELREAGMRSEEVVGRLALLVGLASDPTPRSAASLVSGFDVRRLRRNDAGVVTDPTSWSGS